MLGTFLALSFLFFVMIGAITAISISTDSDWDNDIARIKDDSVLKLVFSGPLKDHLEKRDIFSSIMKYDEPPAMGLYELGLVLTRAAEDDKIKGVFLHFKSFYSGVANAEALRRRILEFKKSGKFVIAYSEAYTELSYIVASVADEVVLYPKGYFEWDGLYSKMGYFKNTLAKLDVVPQVFRVGKYKSAIEPFITDKMSPASREQVTAILDEVWGQVLRFAQEKTKLEQKQLDELAENMSVVFAKQAFEKGFVNFLGSLEEVEEKLMELTGVEDKPNYTSWRTYYKLAVKGTKESSDNQIALVFAKGDITTKPGEGDGISSEALSKLINKIRKKEEIKAVVFRVNSPGGSALASDVIWTSTQWLKDAKPVVTSFGNVAASGGYYMSAGSQYIFAEPSTITGSIGVFGLSFATKKFFNDRIGITFDTAKSHKFSDIESLVRIYKPEEFQKMQGMVDNIYEDFLSVVKQGRSQFKKREQVHEVAQGRVWTGVDAKEVGLVDAFGGMDEAIKKAAELANLTDYSVEVYPKEKSAVEEFLEQFGDVSMKIAQNILPENLIKLIKMENEPLKEKIYTRLPFNLEIN